MHPLAFIFLFLASAAVHAECLPSETGNFHHIEQQDVVNGKYAFKDLLVHGEHLFIDKPNACDGVGRPATTGAGEHRDPIQPAFLRTSGPDSNSCSGCHAQPRAGGGGDFVANVFVLAQAKDPVTFSIAGEESDERNTLGMFGSGAIEMAAREMTAELQSKARPLPDGSHTLTTKGVSFKIEKLGGAIVRAWGIDKDLVVKPFHQAGVVVSLRQFTVNAFNHHHGIQAEERFDLNPAKGLRPDFDEDGISRELTIGDITAATVWQAHLPLPKQVLPADPAAREQIQHGTQLFTAIGCAECHTPVLPLTSSLYSEPNPYNPPDTWSDTSQAYRFDLKTHKVKAYTDLKRHNLCDSDIRYYCNEQLPQGRPEQDGHPGTEYFITRKL